MALLRRISPPSEENKRREEPHFPTVIVESEIQVYRKKKRQPVFRIVLWIFLSFVVILLVCNLWVIQSTYSRIFDGMPLIPLHTTGLLLCTNEAPAIDEVNLYFEHRIQGAVDLYNAGKVRQLVISGEHRSEIHDELHTMKQALVNRGIPEKDIILDSSAYSTFDAVIRMWKVFGKKEFTIISDRFQTHRALFIGLFYGMDPVAFATENVPLQYSVRPRLKEYFIRLKTVGDLYIFHRSTNYYDTTAK